MSNFETILISKVEELQKDKQDLIDIIFSIALTIKDNDGLKAMNNEQMAEWVAKQLRGCGFNTEPCGCSWGVLINK